MSAAFSGTRLVPRREPRVLAAFASRYAVGVVILDPIELRVVRLITFRSHYRAGVQLRAMVAADKPTAIVLPDPVPRVLRAVEISGKCRGIPVVAVPEGGRPASHDDALVAARLVYRNTDLLLDRVGQHALAPRALSLALYALHHIQLPGRRYKRAQ